MTFENQHCIINNIYRNAWKYRPIRTNLLSREIEFAHLTNLYFYFVVTILLKGVLRYIHEWETDYLQSYLTFSKPVLQAKTIWILNRCWWLELPFLWLEMKDVLCPFGHTLKSLKSGRIFAPRHSWFAHNQMLTPNKSARIISEDLMLGP